MNSKIMKGFLAYFGGIHCVKCLKGKKKVNNDNYVASLTPELSVAYCDRCEQKVAVSSKLAKEQEMVRRLRKEGIEADIFPDDEVDSIILLEVAPWDIKAFYNETAPENQRYIVGYYHQIHDTHVEDIAATLEEAVEKFKLFVEDCQELAKYV